MTFFIPTHQEIPSTAANTKYTITRSLLDAQWSADWQSHERWLSFATKVCIDVRYTEPPLLPALGNVSSI